MGKPFIFISLIICFSGKLLAQVNVQSGSAQFEVPVFSFSDGKSGLSHQVSLVYSSGNGLRVNDLPSSIGQGWQLAGGGSVVRKQNGEPDDQSSIGAFPTVAYNNNRVFNEQIAVYDDNYQSFSYPDDCYSRDYIDNYYPNGFLFSEFPLDITENFPLNAAAPRELGFLPRFKSTMDKKYMLSKRALTDRQQDVFVFNVNGMSGEFVIGKDGSIVTLINSKLKIEKTESDMTGSNIRTRINAFKITDENGIIYTFGALSLSEVLKAKEISNTGGDFSLSVSGNDATGKYTVDQWGITSIKNSFTNEEIVFNYIETDVDYVSHKVPSYQLMENGPKEFVNLQEVRIKGKIKNLQSIDFPDGSSLLVNYDGLRQDISGGLRIADIQLKYNNSLVNKLVLTHSYFLKKEIHGFTETFSDPDKRFLRLCLSAVQKQAPDGTNEPPYQFIYNTGAESSDPKDIVPPSDCYAVDHWGYYNKVSIVDINEALPTKEVFKDLMVNATAYRIPLSGVAKFGLIKTIKNPTSGEISFEYSQNTETVNINNLNTTVLTGGVHVSFLKQYDGIDHANDIVTNYDYLLENGNSSAWGYEEPVYNLRRTVQTYKDNLGYKYSGEQIIGAAGNLQKKLIDKDGFFAKLSKINKTIKTIKTVSNAIQTGAYGPLIIAWGYKFCISKIIQFTFLILDPYDYDYSNSYQFFPYNYTNAIGNHFSRVVISNTGVASGKLIQEFSKPTNIATEIASSNFPYSDKQRYTAWKFDQLLKESAVNSLNNPVSETSYSYNTIESQLSTSSFLSCKIEPNYLRSARCEAASYNFPASDLSTDFYYPITGRSEISSTIHKNYSNSGIISQTNATVQYNNDYLPNVTTSIKSNGDQIIKKTYYSNDYNSSVSPAIALLKNNNAIAVPVSSETWLKKSVTNEEYLVDASINEYIVLPNNDVKISKVYWLESKEPIAKANVPNWDAGTLVRSSGSFNFFKVQNEFTYNSDGNLTETKSKGNDISCIINDYNKRFITAVISNAPAAKVAYTSFEATNKGGWYYADLAVLNNINQTPTGNNCYSLTTSSGIWANITLSSNYILSFWAKTDAGVPVVSGTPTLLKAVAVNEWTYYEYRINQGAVNPAVTGPGIIDEIRLYPDNAKMATTTYDPAKGKTSACDINNRIVYYEYDGLGRMVGVRDEKRNLIKTYEYHFKN